MDRKVFDMDRLDACYFCTTPFQMISAMLLVKENQENADLYVIKQFDLAEEYCERLKELKLFRNVSLIYEQDVYLHKMVDNRLLRHFGIAKSYLQVSKFAQNVLVSNTSYARMYVSSRAYIGRMIQFYFIKNKTGTEIIYFDDGEGSYFNNELYVPSRADGILRKVLFGQESINTDHKRYLYDINIFKQLNDETNIESMPAILKNDEIVRAINYVFAVSKEVIPKERVMIFDTLTEGSERDELDACYQMAQEFLGNDHVVLKRHPRDDQALRFEINEYKNASIPFEALSMNLPMDEMLLISFSSTALSTPKIVFGQEPYMILLFDLLEYRDPLADKRRQFYEILNNCYNKHDRIFIPKTMDEYKAALKEVSAGLGIQQKG